MTTRSGTPVLARLFTLLLLAVGAGCGFIGFFDGVVDGVVEGSFAKANSSPRVAIESVDGGCPATHTLLKGTTSTGGSCADGTDCLPACCSCTSDTRRFSAASCTSNKCDTSSTACSNAQTLANQKAACR